MKRVRERNLFFAIKLEFGMPTINPYVRGAVRQFALWIANRSVGHPLLEGVDYSCIFNEPSAMEKAFAIFCNCVIVDDNGAVINFKDAELRAAQWIRSYCEPSYLPEPPLEEWEVELHPVSAEGWNR